MVTILALDLLFIASFLAALALTVRNAIRAQGWRLLALLILPLLPLAYFFMPPLRRADAPFTLPAHTLSTAYRYVSLGVVVADIGLSGVLYARLKGARAFAGVIIVGSLLFNLLLMLAVNSDY